MKLNPGLRDEKSLLPIVMNCILIGVNPVLGRAVARADSRRLPTALARFRSHVKEYKMAVGQVSSGYFGFPCQFSFPSPSSSGAVTTDSVVVDIPNEFSVTAPHELIYNSVFGSNVVWMLPADVSEAHGCLHLQRPFIQFLTFLNA
jgi:hypothetical protein